MTHFNYFCYASLRHAPRLGARPAFPRYAGDRSELGPCSPLRGEPLGARPGGPSLRARRTVAPS